MTLPQIKALNVFTPQHAGPCGALAGGGDYSFSYLAGVKPEAAVSLAMVVRPEPYVERRLPPVFEMNLPEGRIREVIRRQIAKAGVIDSMLLLAITGSTSPIGRLRVEAPESGLPKASEEPVSLSEILKWRGASSLYGELERRYALRSGLSGVQPKVLVPERTADHGDSEDRKTTLPLPDLIVKAGSDEYPHLAVNEFICLTIAQRASMPVPRFYLSEDQNLLVLRRFDRTATGAAIGFEDMAVVMGRSTEHKYVGSYEQVARAVTLYSDDVGDDLARLFDIVALSCIVGNGDAHLKNFGFVYDDPQSPVRLAPAYDIVCTRAYIEGDELALSLGTEKNFFASRRGLLSFGQLCRIDPLARIEAILAATESVLRDYAGLLEEAPEVHRGIVYGFEQFERTFRSPRLLQQSGP